VSTTHRAQQSERPADIPRPVPPGVPPEAGDGTMQQVSGAVAALARRVDQLAGQMAHGGRGPVTLDDRKKALAAAREIVGRDGWPASAERIHAELAVARYLTGE
jgi:hypothetical protein